MVTYDNVTPRCTSIYMGLRCRLQAKHREFHRFYNEHGSVEWVDG